MNRYRVIWSLGIFLGVLLLTEVTFSQEKIRRLDESHPEYTYKNKPITIINRRLGSVAFPSENQMTASSDWIKDLILSVKNTSDKTITFISLELVVRNDGNSPSQFRMRAEFGRPAPITDPDGFPTGEYKRPTLKPGETAEIKVDHEYYSNMIERLRRSGIYDVETLGIDINYVRFEGDVLWSKGAFMHPD